MMAQENSLDDLFKVRELQLKPISVAKLKVMCDHSDEFYSFLLGLLRLYRVSKGDTVGKTIFLGAVFEVRLENIGVSKNIHIKHNKPKGAGYNAYSLRIGFIREFIKKFPFPRDYTSAQEVLETIIAYSGNIYNSQLNIK